MYGKGRSIGNHHPPKKVYRTKHAEINLYSILKTAENWKVASFSAPMHLIARKEVYIQFPNAPATETAAVAQRCAI